MILVKFIKFIKFIGIVGYQCAIQQALNHFPMLFQTGVIPIFVMWAKMSKYGNFAADLEILGKF